jgi:hypothetical protein
MNKEVANFNNLIQKRVDFIENSLRDIHENIFPYEESIAILKSLFINGNINFNSELSNIGNEDIPLTNLYVNNLLSNDLGINNNIKLNNENINFLMNDFIILENINIENGTFINNDSSKKIKINSIAYINENYYKIINIDNNLIKLNDELLFLNNTKIQIFPIYFFSIFNLNKKSIFNIDYLGNFFINPNNNDYENKFYLNIPLVLNYLELNNNNIIKNLNAEFLNGFKSPITGDIVSTTDSQILSNKSFNTDIDLLGNQIKNIRMPINREEIVNKGYIDDLFDIKVKNYINVDFVINKEELLEKYRENDKIFVLNESILYEFKNNNLVKIDLSDFDHYIILLVKGINKGNKYLLYYNENKFIWESCLISINNVQVKVPLHINNENKIELKYNNEYFSMKNNNLNIKKNSINSELLNIKNIPIFFNNGLKGDKEIILENKFEIGLNVDNEKFYFGKEGELKLKGEYDNFKNNFNENKLYLNKTLFIEENLVIKNSLYIKSFIKPVINLNIKLNKKGKILEDKNNKILIQYFINVIKNNYESIIIKSNEIYDELNYQHIFADIEWEYNENQDISGFMLYRKMGYRLEKVFIEKDKRNIIDVLVPDGFSKINWEFIDEINEINNDKFKVLINSNFSFFYHNIGIFESNPKYPIHFKLKDKLKTAIYIDDKRINENTIIKIKNNNNEYKKIESYNKNDELQSFIGINDNILLFSKEQIIISNKIKFNNYNEILGENLFKMQLFDGGLFVEGNIMTSNYNNSYQSYNRLYQNAGLIKTGEYGNSVGDSCIFNWNDNNFEVIPVLNGDIDRKNKIKVKNFVIDHPYKKNTLLAHACLEGPTADVFYRGNANFHSYEYFKIIILPNYFNKLIIYDSITVQLTCHNNYDKIWTQFEECSINKNYFIIFRKNKYKKEINVFWEIKATRKNTEFPVEMNKDEYEIGKVGPYCWIGDKK